MSEDKKTRIQRYHAEMSILMANIDTLTEAMRRANDAFANLSKQLEKIQEEEEDAAE